MASNHQTMQGDAGFSARPYQLEILQMAKQQNTIVCLGTGTGKTFISVMLIKEKQHKIGKTLKENGKRTIFLVNTVPLVYQQSQVIEDHTALTVGKYTGDMNVDSWSKELWEEEFNKNDVLVMTAQILFNNLSCNFFKLNNVNLLILDECHNASGGHPYARILQLFEDIPKHDHPHVMGLTASVINQKYKKMEDEKMIRIFLEDKMKDLEGKMRAACVTCTDFHATASYATKPEELMKGYASGYEVNDFDNIHKLIKETTEMLETVCEEYKSQLGKKRSRSAALMQQSVDDMFNSSSSSSTTNSGMFQMKIPVEVASDTVNYCLRILNELGPLCTYEAAKILTKRIDKHAKRRFKVEDQAILTKCSQILTQLRRKYEEAVASTGFFNTDKVLPMEPFITKKAHVFLKNILLEEKINFGKTALHGIIFVRCRCTAVILSKLINLQAEMDPDNFADISSQYVLGHGIEDNIRLADSFMRSREQDKILKSFKKGEFNVLVATSVVEEGLDVRKCNLVVRFDGVNNYREYVQSKGRARAKDSKFIVMAENVELKDKRKQLKVMQTIEKVLFEKCQGREQPTDEEIEQAQFDEIEEVIPSYVVQSGARITHATAVSLLHRYCALLPHDEYSRTNPIFLPFEHGGLNGIVYTVECILPLNVNLPERKYTSEEFDFKEYCRRDVCLKICKLLHEYGELDDEHLIPVKHQLDSEDDDDDEDIMLGAVKEGTKKSRNIYQRKIPAVLSPSSFKLKDCELYAISMSLTCPYDTPSAIAHWPLWYDDQATGFGVFLPKDLPQIKPFSLYTKAGELTISLVKIPFLHHQADVKSIEKFHETVFTECSVKYTCGELNFDYSTQNTTKCLIVPLKSDIFESLQRGRRIKRIDPIDLTALEHVLNMSGSTVSGDFSNAVIKKTYGEENLRKRSYYVTQVSSKTAGDNMEGSKKTFAKYYLEKYEKDILPDAPLLEVVGSSMKISYEEDVSIKENMARKKSKSSHKELLVGSLCETASNMRKDIHLRMQLLPHIMYRIECITCADIIANEISSTKSITNDLSLRINKLSTDDRDVIRETSRDTMLKQMINGTKKTLPNADDILQCLATRQARFGFDLERLEMLGDSFLKQAITVFLFFKYPNEHEGKLSTKRKRNISNKNLSRIAKRLNLQSVICNSHFFATTDDEQQNRNPRTVWLPPFSTRLITNDNDDDDDDDVSMDTDDESSVSMETSATSIELYPYQEVQDKSLADCIEALIGLYFNHGGVNLALKFMQDFLNLDVLFEAIDEPPKDRIREGTSSCYADFPQVEPLVPEDIAQWLYKGMDRLEEKIGYTFVDKSHLVRAFTHLSYSSGTEIRGCYQEYEFLGDAILDFLVTLHVYRNQPDLSPGELTSLRSALVNNNTFAVLAVKNNFNKFLKYEDPKLFHEFSEFVGLLNDESEEELYSSPFVIVPRDSESGCIAPKVLGDLFESMAGAVFLDSGLDLVVVWNVFYPIMQPVLDKYMKSVPLNPARELQEKFTDAKQEFVVNDEEHVVCTVNIPGKQPVIGIGKNKKIAKSTAAKRALDEYLKR